MKYRDIIGYSKKQLKKKVVKEIKKPSVLDDIKKELNESQLALGIQTMKDKPPFKTSIKEGPAYEYSSFVKNIEKAENQQAKEVNNLVKLLGKKGLKREATDLAAKYMRGMRDFKDFMTKMMRKLV